MLRSRTEAGIGISGQDVPHRLIGRIGKVFGGENGGAAGVVKDRTGKQPGGPAVDRLSPVGDGRSKGATAQGKGRGCPGRLCPHLQPDPGTGAGV